ncbi:hypothetical protein [Marinimicrobium sp. ABcell2]|uniref:hypothetical protein n=1 Tax=Marinimicrobium sp. ABcell2 TaxID=3069751 RepID=UPI0027B5035F|nr:hypothetical protein [Marinimicrobium sp. ABcell2]MDQ2077475.1 hypothetical protein [Marinimicrobium sp. ABcell2]
MMTIKNALLLLCVALIASGCAHKRTASPADPGGSWGFLSRDTMERLNAGEIERYQASAEYQQVNAHCTIESQKIPVPSPSCVQPPRNDCSQMSGFALGLCQGYTPAPSCDYTATNEARAAKDRVYESCMQAAGWEMFWVPDGQNLLTIAQASWAEREPRAETPGEPTQAEMQKVIESIPELYEWQQNDPARWELAVAIDEHLVQQPEYADIPPRARFLKVVERVKLVTE